jgi:hypothetical protein
MNHDEIIKRLRETASDAGDNFFIEAADALEQSGKREEAMREALSELVECMCAPSEGYVCPRCKAISPDAPRSYVSVERVVEVIRAIPSGGSLDLLLNDLIERIKAL